MADAGSQLLETILAEIGTPASPDARAFSDAIRARHGDAVAAVVHYGARRPDDDLHDFFVVVDEYRAAYASRGLAAANALLPPNWLHAELERDGRTLHAKYAVVSRADLVRACTGRSRRSDLWARFAQPLCATWVRGVLERDWLAAAAAEAVVTAVRVGLAAEGRSWQEVHGEPLWRDLFRATYAAELRPDPAAGDAIYAADAQRFEDALTLAIGVLRDRGVLEHGSDPWRCRVRLRRASARGIGASAKLLSALQLAKSALTFDGPALRGSAAR